MLVEILSIPSMIRCLGLSCLKEGDVFSLYREGYHGISDNHWFTYGDKNQFENNLDDLIVNGIEFKVIKVVHEKAQ